MLDVHNVIKIIYINYWLLPK